MKFYVPAICWMQGESDMYDYTNVDYKQKLNQFSIDINKDIKAITHQKQDIKIVSYQTNMLALCNGSVRMNIVYMRQAYHKHRWS